MGKEIQWFKIAESINEIPFGENGLAEVFAGDKKICVGRWNGELFAVAAKCPHAGGILKDGFIDALGNVVCPLHRYKFCLKNGRNVSGEGYYLKHWQIQIKEEGVFAGLDKNSLFSLF